MPKMSNETLKYVRNTAYSLFDSLANAGEFELAKMAYDLLEKIEYEIQIRGGYCMLITKNAVYPAFCPNFKAKKEDE